MAVVVVMNEKSKKTETYVLSNKLAVLVHNAPRSDADCHNVVTCLNDRVTKRVTDMLHHAYHTSVTLLAITSLYTPNHPLIYSFIQINGSPVLVPPVMIQAPVVLAACSRPWWQTRLSFGCRSKLAMPPWTEMTSLGSSRDHCCCSRCKIRSGRVSHDSRMYWQTQHSHHHHHHHHHHPLWLASTDTQLRDSLKFVHSLMHSLTHSNSTEYTRLL